VSTHPSGDVGKSTMLIWACDSHSEELDEDEDEGGPPAMPKVIPERSINGTR
jgi:hypothetical protein